MPATKILKLTSEIIYLVTKTEKNGAIKINVIFMKPAFHYSVKSKLIRFIENGEIKFLELDDTFEDENPVIAREKAFRHYQNFIDVLLENKGLEYTSDKQAREDLYSFLDSGASTSLSIGEEEIDFSESFGNGIGVFLIIDSPIDDPIYEDKKGDEVFIHGIGTFGYFMDEPDRMIFELEKELSYYRYYNYSTKNYETQVLYSNRGEWVEGYAENEPGLVNILSTPFDWTGYDKPYWLVGLENEEEVKEISKPLEEIIKQGETNQIEFKPTLIYNFSTGKGGISIKQIVAKTICAFLNSNGGVLFIGVKDNGEIQGLEHDYSLANGKNPKDYFRLEFDQMLEHFLSFSVKSNITGDFYNIDNKDIFVVEVSPILRRPIFLKSHSGKEFYVRGEASSRQLTDIEEIANYCIDRWIENK